MAQAGAPFNTPLPRHRTDGALACTSCGTAARIEDPAWCLALGVLVCDECCRGLASGEPTSLMSASRIIGRRMRVFEVVASCASCPRMLERVGEALDDEALFT